MKQTLRKTKSICNECLEPVDAEVFEEDGKIYIKKKCEKHGEFTSPHVFDDPETYKRLIAFEKFPYISRKVLFNLTNRCNLNCKFCFAGANEIDLNEFSLEKIKKIDLSKFNYIFLSGGEPTILDDIFEIIKYLKKNKKTVFLLSNGIKMLDDSFTKSLKKSGIDMVVLQFDSMSDKDIVYLRGIPLLEKKLKIIKNLDKYKIPVYFFSIMLKRENLKSMTELVEYFKEYKDIIKGINFNTIWKIGRYDDENWMSTGEITKNSNKVLNVTTEDQLDSTEFIYYLFNTIAKFTDKKRYFSRCLLFILVIFDGDKVIPITKIFNLKKMTWYLKEISMKNRKIKFVNLFFYIIFSQFLLNVFINRNFRIFLREALKKLRFIFDKNKFLMNPFTTFNVGEFPTAEDFDFDFTSTCNLLHYSQEDKVLSPVCLNQIKFAKSEHPLYGKK